MPLSENVRAQRVIRHWLGACEPDEWLHVHELVRRYKDHRNGHGSSGPVLLALAKLHAAGEVASKLSKNGQVWYQLTNQGREVLADIDRRNAEFATDG